MSEAQLPQSCEEHQPKYHEAAWEAYSLQELGSWVHLLAKRSKHRIHLAKRRKDLTDARNYLNMMMARLDALEAELPEEPIQSE